MDDLDPILTETSVPCRSNLQRLEEAGARLVFFSPLSDQLLPPGMSGLYLGGGFPEKHAKALAANRPMRVAIKAFAASGGAVYAECGGLLYLSQSVQPVDDLLPAPMGAHSPRQNFSQLPTFTSCSVQSTHISVTLACNKGRKVCSVCAVGIFPFRTMMTKKMKMGYVEVEVLAACPLYPSGITARGHCYHFSEIIQGVKISHFVCSWLVNHYFGFGAVPQRKF